MHDSTHTSQVHADGRVALWLTGLAFTAIHVAFSGRYGFHRDELLTYSNAMHLDWCYVVYAPLTAWLALWNWLPSEPISWRNAPA